MMLPGLAACTPPQEVAEKAYAAGSTGAPPNPKGSSVEHGSVAFDVSPDGKQILYTHTDRAEYDLMLVENFR